MQLPTVALAALASPLGAAPQKTTVVTVGMNGTLTYAPSRIAVAVGDFVQFQFAGGNHTATQSTFDGACQPAALHGANVTGFHSGFVPAAAGGAMPTYTVRINNSAPVWVYCAQGRHCEEGMVMVINENTKANASRSLANYKTLAARATTIVPGSGDHSSPGTGAGAGSGTTGSMSHNGTAPSGSQVATDMGVGLGVPGALSLLGVVAALCLL